MTGSSDVLVSNSTIVYSMGRYIFGAFYKIDKSYFIVQSGLTYPDTSVPRSRLTVRITEFPDK